MSNYPQGAEYDSSAPFNQETTVNINLCDTCGNEASYYIKGEVKRNIYVNDEYLCTCCIEDMASSENMSFEEVLEEQKIIKIN